MFLRDFHLVCFDFLLGSIHGICKSKYVAQDPYGTHKSMLVT